MAVFFFLVFMFTIGLGGILVFLYSKQKEKAQVFKSLDMSLFLVMMPKYEEQGQDAPKNEKTFIAQMEQIYASFLSLHKPSFRELLFRSEPRIALEIASQIGGSGILFYIAVPTYLETGFEKYVQGIYPKAVVQKVPEDYTIFQPGGVAAGAYLRLKNAPFFPLTTYQNLEKDPLAALTNGLSKIARDEGAAIQIVMRPLRQWDWKKVGEKLFFKIREGTDVKKAMRETQRSLMGDILAETLEALTMTKPKEKKEEREFKPKELLRADERMLQAIQTKLQKEVFEANIRIVACAQTQQRADEIFSHLEGAFGQFGLGAFNSFEAVKRKGRGLQKLVYDFVFRSFRLQERMILNIEELASVYHLPSNSTQTPYIKTVKTVTASPPLELPEKGILPIGKVVFRGEEKIVSFASREDRRRHFYVVGQTGTGKTSLLQEMIRQDIEQGQGVGVIDPHGELIEATLANIPQERMEDVVLFEPFDTTRPAGLNMLEYGTSEQKDFAVQEMIAIFQKLFPPEVIGPMFEHYMRNAMLALMADKADPGTLVDIPRIFTDEQFMELKLQKVADPLVKNFWLREWRQTTGSTKSDMLGYVVSKVGRFVENEMMRNIIGQARSSFDVEKIIDEGKIFFVNLSKGLTGELNSSLLGLILVSKIQMAAMKRARIPEEQRKDFYLYIDEFQNFTTDSIVTILSEARKYRLNLIMAHQYIPQLTLEIRNAVLGNVGTIAAFRIGADDAEFLEKQFQPEFSRFDLINLDNFNLIVKMLIQGKFSSSFRMQTLPPRKGNQGMVDSLKELAKLKYARPRELVETEIGQRSNIM